MADEVGLYIRIVGDIIDYSKRGVVACAGIFGEGERFVFSSRPENFPRALQREMDKKKISRYIIYTADLPDFGSRVFRGREPSKEEYSLIEDVLSRYF